MDVAGVSGEEGESRGGGEVCAEGGELSKFGFEIRFLYRGVLGRHYTRIWVGFLGVLVGYGDTTKRRITIKKLNYCMIILYIEHYKAIFLLIIAMANASQC